MTLNRASQNGRKLTVRASPSTNVAEVRTRPSRRPDGTHATAQVVDFSAAAIGASFRRQRPGPETELVDWFLSELPIKLPARCKATIFREPRLDSGFPDLVIAIWHETRTTRWTTAREHVSAADLRIMHYLVERRAADRQEIASVFGRTATASLRRLTEAEMVRHVRTHWEPQALSASFALRNLIAVEAKIAQWSSALRQAFTNTWFASSSYVLLPRVPKKSALLREADSLGIEVWVKDRAPFDWRTLAPAPRPRSYASWLFNEWVWRVASGTRI